jgi:hypothetical protein
MGISLFGLTPAATYPSLIKFGDNSAISGTLRALSDGLGTDLPIQVSTAGVNFTGTASIGGTAIITNASGVSGAIQFSNGSAFASDAANFFWDNTNKRLGIGTNSPASPLSIVNTIALSAGATNPRIGNIAYTINNSGAQTGTLTGIYLNATETALNGQIHNLMNLQVGGVNKFIVKNTGEVVSASDISATTGGYIQWEARSSMRSITDGVIALYDFARTSFNRLQLGGTTSSFPAIKRNGTAIDICLADDSNFASLNTNSQTITSTIALSAGATNPRIENIAYTINNSGAQTGTATGIFLNATETALNGMTHNLIDLQVGGVSKFTISNLGGITATSGNSSFAGISINDYVVAGSSFKISFGGLRTYTSGNGVEIGRFGGSINGTFTASSGTQIGTAFFNTVNQSGTGAFTDILLNSTETTIGSGGHNLMDLQRDGVSRFRVDKNGAFQSVGSGIISTVIIDGNIYPTVSNGSITLCSDGSATGAITLYGGTNPTTALRGNVLLNPSSLIYLKGTTSSFPAIKRNGAAIDFRLADDSNFCAINAGATTIKGSGSTSATTSLLVQDSTGQEMFRIRDNNQIDIRQGQLTFANPGADTWRIFNGGVSPKVVGVTWFAGTGTLVVNNGTNVSSSSDSAQLEVVSTTKGFLPPRMTTTQKNAIATPVAGLVLYDSTTNKLNYNNGTVWKEITPDGYTGMVTINTAPPVTFDIQNGIIVNVI